MNGWFIKKRSLLSGCTSCVKIPGASSTTYPMRINYSIVFNRLGSILSQNDWKNYLILHDDYFDESYIAELERTLQQSAVETKRENMEGGTMKIFNKESTKDLQSILIDLNTAGLYTNFILMASQENTAQFLSRAEKLGLFGVNYKWVLANMDLDVTKFQGRRFSHA